MEPIPLCTRQIIAASEQDVCFAQQMPQAFAGILAPCAEKLPDSALPRGIVLTCPAVPDELDFPATETYIALCKQAFRPKLHKQAAFYYLRGASDFRALRAAVLAMTDLCGRSIITEIHTGEDGRMQDNTDCLAALGVLQRIGVSTVIFTASHAEHLEDTLERVAPYARISMGVRVPCQWLKQGIRLTNVEILLPAQGQSAQMLWEVLSQYTAGRTASRDHDDYILAPDGRDAHFIDAVTNISDEIECDHKLQERLLEIEDEQAAALKLVLQEEDELYNLESDLYMLTRPVCLCAPTPELLEKALRIYTGLAIYDGTWELTPEVFKYFSEKYGMIGL